MDIKLGHLDHPKVLALLQLHLDAMHETSPAEHVHALDVTGLQGPDMSFWTLWEKDDLLGCGALKELSSHHGEIKSMRTHPNHLRKGVAAQLLEYIIQTAKTRGYTRLSLETGNGAAFDPALKLYRKYRFKDGPAFADYTTNDFSQFLQLEL